MLLPLAEFSPLSADFQLNIWNVLLFVSTLATLWRRSAGSLRWMRG
jgi:hypothetical protein